MYSVFGLVNTEAHCGPCHNLTLLKTGFSTKEQARQYLRDSGDKGFFYVIEEMRFGKDTTQDVIRYKNAHGRLRRVKSETRKWLENTIRQIFAAYKANHPGSVKDHLHASIRKRLAGSLSSALEDRFEAEHAAILEVLKNIAASWRHRAECDQELGHTRKIQATIARAEAVEAAIAQLKQHPVFTAQEEKS